MALRSFVIAALLVTAPAAAQSFPGETVVVHVHGFTPFGNAFHQPFGVDITDLNDVKYGKAGFDVVALADLLDRPTILDPGGEESPDLVTSISVYGNQYPPYYDAQDRAELDAVTAQWNGGVPRYAAIVAKFCRHVLERTGAEQVDLVAVSLGGEVTRWMLEHDVEGLASEGRIGRWITHEGVLRGNWAATWNITDVLTYLGILQSEVDHMDYDWVNAHLHSPREELDNELLANVQIAHGVSVRDDLVFGALSAATYLFHFSFLPNDGINLVEDGSFESVTPRSRYLGRTPTLSYYNANHFTVREDEGMLAQLATVLSSSRRVTVTLTRAKVSALHEVRLPFLRNDSEVVFGARAFSPWVETTWAIPAPLSVLHHESGVPPLTKFRHRDSWKTLDWVVYDDFVRDEESELRLRISAVELDWAAKYGMYEVPTNPLTGLTEYPAADALLTLDQPGTFSLSSPEWEVELAVSIDTYPSGRVLFLRDSEDPERASTSAAGEASVLALAAGPDQAGLSYALFGGVSGTSPGTALPGGLVLPVNRDPYTDQVIAGWNSPLYRDFLGTLDGTGRGLAVFNADADPLPPAALGRELVFAAAIHDPASGLAVRASEPVFVQVTP